MGFFGNLFTGMANSFGSGFGSGAASGLINLLFNSPNKQMRNQRRLMSYQSKLNKDMFDYQYQKELPSVRVQQLKEAGLNPGLMYSGAGVSGMNAQIGHSSPTPAPQMDIMTSSNPLASAQIENIKTNTQSQVEDIKLKRLEQIEQELENLRKKKENDKWDEKYQAEYDKLLAEKDNILANTKSTNADFYLKKQQWEINKMVKDYKISEAESDALISSVRAHYMDKYHEEIPTTNLSNIFGVLIRSIGGNKNFNWSDLINNGEKIIDFVKRKWAETHNGVNPTNEEIQQTATALEYLITHRDDPTIEKIFRGDLK